MTFSFCMRISMMAAVGLTLSGCAGLAPSPHGGGNEAGVPAPQQPAPAPGAPARTGPEGGPAVVALLGQANSERQQGDLTHSDATLERALRIEPRNPRIWSRLASLRLAQGNPEQAEAFALKSNSLADANPALRADNWDIIAQARRMGGDSNGAQRALQQAAALREQGS